MATEGLTPEPGVRVGLCVRQGEVTRRAQGQQRLVDKPRVRHIALSAPRSEVPRCSPPSPLGLVGGP